ncbi:23782_t:CDS:2, partial [Racocetra persica]
MNPGHNRKPFVGGNFKMNGSRTMVKEIIDRLNALKLNDHVEVVIAPPTLYIDQASKSVGEGISIAAQNAFNCTKGAYTGEISPEQLKDVGVNWVILGHSERRDIFKEADDFVASKVAHALRTDMKAIVCIGEKLEEREANQTKEVVIRQLQAVANNIDDLKKWENVVIAYEPVWAIGTGKVATPEQ